MRKILYILAAIALPYLALSCKIQGNKNGGEAQEIETDSIELAEVEEEFWGIKEHTKAEEKTQLLDIFYGIKNHVDTGRTYRGTSCAVDSIPGVLRWERFNMWGLGDGEVKFESSLCLYVDSVFPNRAIARAIAVHADSTLRHYFFFHVDRSEAPRPDLKQILKGEDIADFCNQCYEVQDTVMKLRTAPDTIPHDTSLPCSSRPVSCI